MALSKSASKIGAIVLFALVYTGRGQAFQRVDPIRQKAEQGDATAQFSLGVMYLHSSSEGGPQDYVEARKWLLKAAERGHSEAQFLLGSMYEYGRGVPQDYVRAYLWFNLATSRAKGDDRKQFANMRDRTAAKMTPAQIAEAQRLAREWKPKKTAP